MRTSWKRQFLTCREGRMGTKKDASTIYFGGKQDGPEWKSFEETVWTQEMFLHFVMTVWINRNEVPTEPPALTEFRISSLWSQYRVFIESGERSPQRGGPVEEQLLALQLMMAQPITCLLNSAQPDQPVGRITRLRKLTSSEIWSELQNFYTNPKLDRPF